MKAFLAKPSSKLRRDFFGRLTFINITLSQLRREERVSLVSHHQRLLVVESSDDGTLVVVIIVHQAVVVDGGVSGGGAVVGGHELSKPVPHPPVGVSVVGNASPQGEDDHQDPDDCPHSTGLFDDYAVWLGKIHHDDSVC